MRRMPRTTRRDPGFQIVITWTFAWPHPKSKYMASRTSISLRFVNATRATTFSHPIDKKRYPSVAYIRSLAKSGSKTRFRCDLKLKIIPKTRVLGSHDSHFVCRYSKRIIVFFYSNKCRTFSDDSRRRFAPSSTLGSYRGFPPRRHMT